MKPQGPDSTTNVQAKREAAAPESASWPFANSYPRLPNRFYSHVKPVPVAAPALIALNVELARLLGLDAAALASPDGVAVLAGNLLPAGAEPLALAYAGHQFGHFVPQLGDGRANLLGEVVGTDGVLYDIQLKGSGPTPFSRRGDGRAALGPVLREYLLSEAMAALGVPTTRALAAVTTGQPVVRETLLPGAVFTRVAKSHLRVGSFQYPAAQGDVEGTRALAQYAIERHYPEAAESAYPVLALLQGVIGRQARLVARWMTLGFVHGVMNTDNTSIAGETIDYGPCAFLEAFDPATVFSSIDHQGRYAYGNQPYAAHWNLSRLAEALLPVLETERGDAQLALAAAQDALAAFEPEYERARLEGFRRKLGLLEPHPDDASLVEDTLELLAAQAVDFTLFFRRLADTAAEPVHVRNLRSLFDQAAAYEDWFSRWERRVAGEAFSAMDRAEAMRLANPAVIPRNHQVAAVIDAAVQRQDFEPFHRLLRAVAQPYVERAEFAPFTVPALPEECVTETFCGT